MFVILALLWSATVNALVPQEFTYQGYLTTANSTPVNGTVSMVFRLYLGPADGASLYDETQSVPVSNGSFAARIGSVTSLALPFDVPYYLGITVGGDTEMMPRQILTSTPYAIRSAAAESLAASATINSNQIAGIFQVINGGTGHTTLNDNGVLYGRFEAPIGAVVGASGQVLAGSAGAPYFTGSPSISGDVSIGSTVTVAGNIETTGGGFKFSDGTVQSTAAAPAPLRTSKQIATLRWYEADQAGIEFGVGSSPRGIAFDGESMWISHYGSSYVTKLRASDGACVTPCTHGVGFLFSNGIAYDGANVWIANTTNSSVTRLRAFDGTCVAPCTFAVGNTPLGVAFDGTNIWVANSGNGTVTKLRASDGACVGGSCAFVVGSTPNGIAFDGTSIWVANSGSGTVTKLRASDGACVGVCTFSVGTNPHGLAFDGSNIWAANSGSANVTKLRASDGTCLSTCTFAVGANPNAIVFDGTNVWVTNMGSNDMTRLRAADGVCISPCTIALNTSPYGVAFDGANIWATNSGNAIVSKR